MELPVFEHPWQGIWQYNESVAEAIVDEVLTELGRKHALRDFHLQALARRVDCDEVLLYVCDYRTAFIKKSIFHPRQFVLASLTWSGYEEQSTVSSLIVLDSIDGFFAAKPAQVLAKQLSP